MVVRLISAIVVVLSISSSKGADAAWPCYHGPERTNRSAATGLLKRWPAEGLKLVWSADGIGYGYSSVAVVGRRVFTAGMVDRETHVVALDVKDGSTLWTRGAGASWQASSRQRWAVPYAGSRATPTIDGDRLYFLSELGNLLALDAATGKEHWRRNLAETFEAGKPEYGYSESVLVYHGRLFCAPGGKTACLAALDPRDGSVIWSYGGIDDAIGYASPVMAEIDGVQQLITVTAERILAVRPDSGQLLWQREFANSRDNNATDVIVHDGLVYASSGYGRGSILLKPRLSDDGRFSVTTVWERPVLDNHHGGVVLVDGYLYGAGHEAEGWFALDVQSGRTVWQAPGKGALTVADGMLYCLDERGAVSLVRAAGEASEVVSTFHVPNGGRGPYWAHPVVCGGRLYIRHADTLYAYDVSDQ